MKNKLINLISEVTNKNLHLKDISKNFDLINDFGIDSIQMINLLLKIEDDFDIRLDYNNLKYDDIRSINNLLLLIQKSQNLKQ